MTPAKYRNEKTQLDGLTFDSKKEARRYSELKLLERAGKISDLQVQPVFPLVVNGKRVCAYRGDFNYIDAATGERVVEDVKSDFTRKLPVYRLKAKLFAALMGFAVREV